MNRVDPDIDNKTRSSIRFLNETIQYNANEPSLAFYRIQEHIDRTLPGLVQRHIELEILQEKMDGLVFDIQYGTEAVTNSKASDENLTNIVKILETGIGVSRNISLIRQQQVQQQLFQKKDTPLISSSKS